MKAFNQPINEFLKEASSSSPTPGGGSIAALSSALGISMASMVANLSLKNNSNIKIKKFIEIVNDAIDTCEFFLEEDKRCFTEYMSVLKMPKVTKEDIVKRNQALSKASELAADIPRQLMEFGVSLLREIDEFSSDINKNVASDLGISAILLDASIQSAWITVQANLKTIKNEQVRIQYERTGLKIVKEARTIKENILLTVEQLM